jgi:hypothetical protein
MIRAASSGRRAGALLFALGMQAIIVALLFVSLQVARLIAPAEETILHLRPAMQKPVTIDARQPAPPKPPADMPPSAVTTSLPALGGSGGIAARPDTAQPPSGPELMQRLESALACRPDERGRPSPLCSIEVKPADPRALVLNPPSQVKDPEFWAEEKRRAESNDLGVAVGPGVGFAIQEPLCKLAWVVFGGGISCGAPPLSTRPATDAQFKAALAAYHQRRGGGPRAALPSTPSKETGNEKDRPAGSGAGVDPVASPGRP